MAEAVFDTDILVDHLRAVRNATELVYQVRSGRITGYISTITEAELYAGKDQDDEKKNMLIAELLGLFEKVEVNSTIARSGGILKRVHGVAVTDALIAATALSLGCKLLTRNVKDYEMIKGLALEKPY